MGSPFILPRAGVTPLTAPPGFPPDVAPNQIIYASHINAIRDSVAIWPGNVDGNGKNLTNVAKIAASGGAYPTPSLDLPNLYQYIQLGSRGILQSTGVQTYVASNAVFSGAGQWTGIVTAAASLIQADAGSVGFYANSSVTAGVAFTPTEVMRITPAGITAIGNAGFGGHIRSTGYGATPTSGAGMELYYHPGYTAGIILAYDRSASSIGNIRISGNQVAINADTVTGTTYVHTNTDARLFVGQGGAQDVTLSAQNAAGSANVPLKFNAGGDKLVLNSDGTIQMFLGGSLKTLSVDGSGFVKAA